MTSLSAPLSNLTSEETPRYQVHTRSIDPEVPQCCVRCLTEDIDLKRQLSFRRSDGTVERVSVLHWPYCHRCHADLAPFDRQQRLMTYFGGIQTLVVFYLLGGAVAIYDVWWPSLWLLAASFVAFLYSARKARQLWGLEWARIEDVLKGGAGALYSFRNQEYAKRFAEANASSYALQTD